MLIREAAPARLEWSYWTSAGAAHLRNDGWSATAGLGAELTTGITTYTGFPAGSSYNKRRRRGELRAGGWSSASTRAAGGVVEGGGLLKLGAEYHAVFGTFDLRLGAGYGAFDDDTSPHATATLTYGVYSVPARYSQRGFCDPEPRPRATALASVARLFATQRRRLSDERAWEVVFGVELSPSFALPPHGWGRLSGGWPW